MIGEQKLVVINPWLSSAQSDQKGEKKKVKQNKYRFPRLESELIWVELLKD